jgi:hypothetical protein
MRSFLLYEVFFSVDMYAPWILFLTIYPFHSLAILPIYIQMGNAGKGAKLGAAMGGANGAMNGLGRRRR